METSTHQGGLEDRRGNSEPGCRQLVRCKICRDQSTAVERSSGHNSKGFRYFNRAQDGRPGCMYPIITGEKSDQPGCRPILRLGFSAGVSPAGTATNPRSSGSSAQVVRRQEAGWRQETQSQLAGVTAKERCERPGLE